MITTTKQKKTKAKNVIKDQKITEEWALYNGDCCLVLPQIPDDSIGFSCFSPPFADLYSYSDDEADMGNCQTSEQFFEHFGFLVSELQRILLPGRIVGIHCMDLPVFKQEAGHTGLYDFPGDIVQCFLSHDFIFHSRHIVWKDPLVAATRTKAQGLAHHQICRDSSLCRMGICDQVLAFRKKGENPKPIENEFGLTDYWGARKVPAELNRWIGWKGPQRKNKRSQWIWQQYASPVWMDIRQTKVLKFRGARDPKDTKHICPLQIDVVERMLALWSAPGDTTLDPFTGVGTLPYCSVRNGRKAVGVELKESYYRQALRHVKNLQKQQANKGFQV